MSYTENTITTPSISSGSAFGTPESAPLTPVFQGDFAYGLNVQMWNTAVTSGTGATVDTNAARLRLQCGTNNAGYAYITSRKIIRYRAGQGSVVRFTPLFSTGLANNDQFWGVGTIVSNAPYDGYYFGYHGTSFGIIHYNAGTPNYIAQGSWNGDKVDGTAGTSFNWDPTKGVAVQIKYPYLGYGNIFFQAQNPNTGQFVTVHTIKYGNTSASTELSNANLQVVGYTKNSGNTTNLTMYLGSVGVFVSGVRNFVGNAHWATDNKKNPITTETALLSIKNCTTYNGVTNRGMIRLNSVSMGSDSSSLSVLRIKTGVTLGGSPSYTPVNGSTGDGGVTLTAANSIASVDTAGTTVTGGLYIYNFSIGSNGNGLIDLTPFEIFLPPGEIMTFSGFATSASTLGVSVNWSEDV